MDEESARPQTAMEDPDADYHPRRPSGLNPLSLPGPLTWKQKFYIVGPQMIGAAFIDGAANFGVACAMYRKVKPPKQILLWPLSQNTIAGDMAVTVFIQGIATFCIASGMVHVDLRRNKIDAFPYPWPDTAFAAKKVSPSSPDQPVHGRLWREFHNEHGLGRGLHFFSGSDVNDIFDFSVPKKALAKRWFWSIWKGSVLSALYFCVVWPIAIAITAPLFGGRDMRGTWIPEIIKLVFGAVLGLLMNPLCALIAMGSEDSVRHHRAEVQRRRFADAPPPRTVTTTAAEQVRGAMGRVRRLTVGAKSSPTSAAAAPPDSGPPLPSTDLEKGEKNGVHRRTSEDRRGGRYNKSPPTSPASKEKEIPSVADFRRSLDAGSRPLSSPTSNGTAVRGAEMEGDETPADRRRSFEAALRSGGASGLNRSPSGRAALDPPRPTSGKVDVGQERLSPETATEEGHNHRLRRLTEAAETGDERR